MSKKHLFTLSGLLALTTIVSGTILSSTITHADDSVVDTVEVTVNTACTLSSSLGTTTGVTATTDGEGNNTYTTTMNMKETKEINASIFSTVCNDSGGYSLYAIGYSGDSYDAPNNTKMLGTDSNINTSTATTGDAGSWSMKLAAVSGYTPPTILNNFNNYHVIPDTYTQIAKYTSTTASAASPGATVQAKYQIYTGIQPADTYTGKVKYTIVHPNDAPAPVPPQPPLYDTVAKMSKGTQTVAELRTAIDASNSGVYEYDPSVFGTASDAANTSTIYYYRGILDNTTGSYGSDGDNAAWPNTVLLDTTGNGKDTTDTCWRIVRTTGSGGVKMIYQGKWTGSTCANSSTSANAVSSAYFNRRSTSATNYYDTKGRIIYAGYNFSSNSSHQTGTSSVNNSDLFVNGTESNLRTQLESWYNSNMTAWTSKLETSAGWCNDRTTYSSTTTSSKTTSNIPYQTSSASVNFGAYIRNGTTNSQPTLGCPNDTGYDLLTTSNGYIGVPSAPLTADEAAFAGSGYSASTTPYHANSYLHSGDFFWLLSPGNRYSSGNVAEFRLDSDGYLFSGVVSFTDGVRPSISLASGTTATSGTGTAADPWIVNP